VHNTHGYLAWDTLEPTESMLQGQTVIGLYFSADWCPPCQVFTTLLKQLHSSKQAHCSKANRNIPPFEVVLVSGCRDPTATNHYFSTKPWTAMIHAEAVGKWGLDLQNRFGIKTIPALVLLDGEGAVLCWNAQWRLQEDPTGAKFLWQDPPVAPCLPQVGFDLVLPDGARLATPLQRPPGRPPPFTPIKPTQAQNS
jgi:thiol-disulfide isomerase/thioredoxin